MSDGKECECYACCASSCGCDNVDWTPREVYDLREKIASLEAENGRLKADAEAEHLRAELGWKEALRVDQQLQAARQPIKSFHDFYQGLARMNPESFIVLKNILPNELVNQMAEALATPQSPEPSPVDQDLLRPEPQPETAGPQVDVASLYEYQPKQPAGMKEKFEEVHRALASLYTYFQSRTGERRLYVEEALRLAESGTEKEGA